ncbi:MAG: hypothetical protein RLZZ422_809 [Pseudomonadota bacterium]
MYQSAASYMTIFVIGVNHKTAPVQLRERVAFTPERLQQALHETRFITAESLILSTCNRTELYLSVVQPTQLHAVTEWFANFHGISLTELKPYLYTYETEQAVQHALRVACGLDSLILGEPQILGQLKEALKSAHTAQSTGNQLNRLLQHAFTTAKKVRTQTNIGANPVSVAFAAVNLAKQIFSHFERQTALLVGAGETIELVGKHLAANNIGHIIIANRSLHKAQALAEQYNGLGVPLTSIAEYLPKADIVISSTAAPLPIIGKGMVERALKQRKHRPIFMVDIAVPRDIEPEVSELDDIYLYTVDDLQSVIEENLQSRREAAAQAEEMVVAEVGEFAAWLRAQQHMQLIRDYRQQNDQTRQEVLSKAKHMLDNQHPAEEVLEFLAHTLTNKLTHAPTQALNHAARVGDYAQLEYARKLFNLTDRD